MNTPADSTTPETDTRPGEVRTYRGRTVEELIPQIRAELGPGAMILRERQGLTGGVGGFFAKRCVEIDAQSAPRLSVYADDAEAALGQPAAEQTPDPFAGFAARLEQAASGAFAPSAMPDPFGPAAPAAPSMPAPAMPAPAMPAPAMPAPAMPAPAMPAPAMPAPAMPAPPMPAPAMPTPPMPAPAMPASAMPAPAMPAPAQPAMRTAAPAPPAADFIAFDEMMSELEPEAAMASVPTAVFDTGTIDPEPAELTVPILLDVAPATPGADSVFRPRPLQRESSEQPSAFRQVLDTPTSLRERLAAGGLSAALAEQLIAGAADAAGSPEESMLAVTAQATLAAMLPQATPLPIDGGVVAVVGAGSSGKTRAVAALAAACARAGHSVTVARLGGADRDDELSELLADEQVELVPVMKTKATVRAVGAAREEDLVILDTPSTTPGEDGARDSLAATLERLSPETVLLCAPATFTQPALTHLVEHHAPLQIDGLIATHADQAGMLGTVAELSIETRIPLGHVHAGLDVASAISSVDPGTLASDLVR